MEDAISNSEIFLPNYSVYRKDRNRQGGGVFIAVRTDIPSCDVNIASSLEIIWVQLHTISSSDVILGCFYRPPHLPPSILDNLRDSLQYIRSQFPGAKIILGGDFNFPGIDWSTGTLFESYISPTLRDTLITTMDDFLMQKVVIFPTRGTNILDLCFTTDPDLQLVQSCQPFPGVSDHDIVLLKFQLQTIPPKNNKRKTYLYSRANWDAIRENIVTISDQYFLQNQNTTKTVEENWSFFHTHITKLIDEHIPSKYVSNKTNRSWMSASLKRLIRKK